MKIRDRRPEKLLRGGTGKLLLIGAALGLGFLATGFYRLQTGPRLLVLAGTLPAAFLAESRRRRRKREAERFGALGNLMEQLLYLFRRRPKLTQALQEAEETADAELQPMIRRAAQALLTRQGEDPYEEAFRPLLEAFPCRELRQLLHFFRKVEETGGEYAGGLDLLLEQIRSWCRAEDLYQQELNHVRTKVELCLVLSVLIGGASVNLIPESFSILALPAYQWFSAVLLLLLLAVFAGIELAFTKPWGREKPVMSEEAVRRYKARLENREKDRKLPLKLGLALVLAMLCLYLKAKAACAGCAVLALLFITEPRRKRGAARRRLAREVQLQFPDWLRELAMILQFRTVQTAISETEGETSPVLRVWLEQLLREIDEDPVHITPYRNFMQELELAPVRDAMVLLYSLNGVGRQYAREQLEALTRRNEELYREAETLRRRDAASWASFVTVIPMSLTVIKLLSDMAMTLTRFLGAYA